VGHVRGVRYFREGACRDCRVEFAGVADRVGRVLGAVQDEDRAGVVLQHGLGVGRAARPELPARVGEDPIAAELVPVLEPDSQRQHQSR
jgi:hypothetical protein